MAIDKITASGLGDGGVSTADIADANITTAKILDDAVTADKLADVINNDIAAKATKIEANVLESNIAILGFYRASDNAKTVYNLVNQVIDEYTDSSGIASTTPSGLVLSGATGSKYYSSSYGSTTTSTVTYTGSDTTIALANGDVVTGTAKAWGAGGGSDSVGSGKYGASGGFVGGTLSFTSDGTDLILSAGQGGPRGISGGSGGTGGGYSGIFLGSKTHGNAILVAGAGGGAGDNMDGGDGGGTTGVAGEISGAGGGTQSAGGSLGSGSSSYSQPTAGSALQGGLGGADSDASSHPTAYNGGGRQGTEPGGTVGGGGGGGGYYGGAGGHAGSTGAGGGGGSSYHNASYFSSVTNSAGSGNNSGGASDANYPSGVGTSGTSTAGGNGAVYISYTISSTSSTAEFISTASTASTAPSKGDVVMMIENATGTATLNTDIKVYVSRNNGTNWTQGTLVEEGSWGTNKKILAFHDLDISGQPSGTAIKYKVELANQAPSSKMTRVHATSLAWS
tara:strand:+ start:1 stop:1527 length:1527 start_codon:yes stop_codon:yes gene_type:complete